MKVSKYVPRPWSRDNRPAIGPRTLNPHEIHVVQQLEAEGYEVIKVGWPDFLAVRPGEKPRFIEVKPGVNSSLTPRQRRMAEILREHFGIEVELARPPDYLLRVPLDDD